MTEEMNIVKLIERLTNLIDTDMNGSLEEKEAVGVGLHLVAGFLGDINRIANALEKIADNTEPNVAGLDEDYVRATVHNDALKEDWRFNNGQMPNEKRVDVRFNNGSGIEHVEPNKLEWGIGTEGMLIRHWRPAQ